ILFPYTTLFRSVVESFKSKPTFCPASLYEKIVFSKSLRLPFTNRSGIEAAKCLYFNYGDLGDCLVFGLVLGKVIFKAFSIISLVILPYRKTIGTSPVQSKTVDSKPTPVLPPLIINGIFPVKSFDTCCAEVGLGLPDKFALGAATGN